MYDVPNRVKVHATKILSHFFFRSSESLPPYHGTTLRDLRVIAVILLHPLSSVPDTRRASTRCLHAFLPCSSVYIHRPFHSWFLFSYLLKKLNTWEGIYARLLPTTTLLLFHPQAVGISSVTIPVFLEILVLIVLFRYHYRCWNWRLWLLKTLFTGESSYHGRQFYRKASRPRVKLQINQAWTSTFNPIHRDGCNHSSSVLCKTAFCIFRRC